MIKYKIKKSTTHSHSLDIDLSLQTDDNEVITLNLPTWRPGRYELANYAENLEDVKISGNATIKKISRHSWEIDSPVKQNVTISYRYYAHKMDAGNSWVDENQIYINFINLLLGVKNQEQMPCEVELDFPVNYHIQCALDLSGNTLLANTYLELIDSPLFASENLNTSSYKIEDSTFELIVQGNYETNDQVLKDFSSFTKVQMDLFDGFPADNYKFMIQALPYRHYHGVEHKDSTVITIGPDKQLSKRKLYKELLGVSSHELFHCWNVTRIKPKEFIPYDFSKECYYDTGFITEGLTTYYGDLMLIRSKVFSLNEYLDELSSSIQRHLENPGRHKQSLLESSMDLWIDGYKNQAPFRGVSIYTKGLIVALILDLKIILDSNGTQSLDNVLKDLWAQFGDSKTGYNKEIYQEIISKYIGQDESEIYMQKYIYGTEPIEIELNELLKQFGFQIDEDDNKNPLQSDYGIKTLKTTNGDCVKRIDNDSLAKNEVSIDDIITNAILGNQNCKLELLSSGIKKSVELKASTKKFFPLYKLNTTKDISPKQEKLKNYWLFRQ